MESCSALAICVEVLWLRRSIPTKRRAAAVAVFDHMLTFFAASKHVSPRMHRGSAE